MLNIIEMKKTFFLLFVYLIPFQGFSQNWDINLLKEINLNRNTKLDPVFKTISASTMPLSLAIPASAITIAQLKKDDDSRKKALLISSSLATAAVVSATLKYTVNRERPYDKYPYIQNITSEGSPSFPSAHASFSFSLATSVSLVYPKWYIVAPAYLWAGSVGYSRMHLGVHYPSDVIIGALIGSGSTYLSYRLNNWMDKKWRKQHSSYSY
jgi:membrane-associated phospholipid phosphatase